MSSWMRKRKPPLRSSAEVEDYLISEIIRYRELNKTVFAPREMRGFDSMAGERAKTAQGIITMEKILDYMRDGQL